MHPWLQHRRTGVLLVLAALLARAYIPIGFMPAAGSPGALSLCPTGLPSSMLEQLHLLHHAHSGAHGGFDHCPFGSAPAGAPLAQWALHVASPTAIERLPSFSSSLPFELRLLRAQQARAPPLTA